MPRTDGWLMILPICGYNHRGLKGCEETFPKYLVWSHKHTLFTLHSNTYHLLLISLIHVICFHLSWQAINLKCFFSCIMFSCFVQSAVFYHQINLAVWAALCLWLTMKLSITVGFVTFVYKEQFIAAAITFSSLHELHLAENGDLYLF